MNIFTCLKVPNSLLCKAHKYERCLGTFTTNFCSANVLSESVSQTTLPLGRRITMYRGSDLPKQENMLLFVWTLVAESKPVKLETSHTVTLPSTVNILFLCLINLS